jgi:hypothetical protein
LPVCASQCRCDAVGRNTLPLHSSSPHSLCKSSLCTAIARPIESQPCRCQAVHRTASANPGRQCHALALRLSPHRRCK